MEMIGYDQIVAAWAELTIQLKDYIEEIDVQEPFFAVMN